MLLRCWDPWDRLLRDMLLRCWDPWDRLLRDMLLLCWDLWDRLLGYMLLRCWDLWDRLLRYMLLRCWDLCDRLPTLQVATRYECHNGNLLSKTASTLMDRWADEECEKKSVHPRLMHMMFTWIC